MYTISFSFMITIRSFTWHFRRASMLCDLLSLSLSLHKIVNSRQGEEWSHYRKILSPLLLKMATLRRHLESLNDVADILLNRWKCAENGVISNVERDLYCYFVQVTRRFCMLFLLDMNQLSQLGTNVSSVWKNYRTRSRYH